MSDLATTRPPGAAQRRAAPRLTPPRVPSSVAAVSMCATVLLWWWALRAFFDSLGVMGAARTVWAVVLVVLAVGALATLVPAALALVRTAESARHLRDGDLPEARADAERARQWDWYVLGLVLTLLILSGLVWFVTAEEAAIRRTFLRGDIMREFWPSLRRGIWFNIRLALAAQAVVLVWSLVVAVVRMLPGRAGAPVRVLVTAYTDVFRGLPAIVTIYTFVFGMQVSGLDRSIPLVGSLDRSARLFWLCVIAIVLVYGAYVSEVYRAGLESIHRSQVMAARSLGLSQVKTLRHVVIPQAVRRVVPPLLNDFIALQKDTALVAFIGVQDVLNRSQVRASREANLTPVIMAGLAFLVLTIPQTRFVDWLVARDQRRLAGGSR